MPLDRELNRPGSESTSRVRVRFTPFVHSWLNLWPLPIRGTDIIDSPWAEAPLSPLPIASKKWRYRDPRVEEAGQGCGRRANNLNRINAGDFTLTM